MNDADGMYRALLLQLVAVFERLQVIAPTPERNEALQRLRPVRNHVAHSMHVDTETVRDAVRAEMRVLIDDIDSGSLGTVEARLLRLLAEPDLVTEAIARSDQKTSGQRAETDHSPHIRASEDLSTTAVAIAGRDQQGDPARFHRDVDPNFGARLRQSRMAAGMSLSQLAANLNYSKSYLSKVENGKKQPSHELMERVAAIETDTEALVTGIGHQAPQVPTQLPADVFAFAGRERELTALNKFLEEADSPPTVVVGTAGVGKTALAVRWAHRVRDQFPDGQLYLDLRGYDSEQPLSVADALARLLAALGLAGSEIPLDPDDRAARYRTELSDRRMLVLLDNAATSNQVRPLLPGAPGCQVVVTSRDSLAGLVARHGARRLDLHLLPLQDAVRLLGWLIGDRVTAEPAAAETLAEECARLPLALRIAAELAAARPRTPLSVLVDELADEQRRLDLLDAGADPRTAVHAVFSWSYQHLTTDAAATFRLLGLHPGQDLDLYAAAALGDTSLEQARQLLDLLARAHLVQEHERGRYVMHDLLHAYANRLAGVQNSPAERDAALTRLLNFYLGTAAAAMDALHPAERHRRPHIAAPTTPTPTFAGAESAKVWLDAERANLVVARLHWQEAFDIYDDFEHALTDATGADLTHANLNGIPLDGVLWSSDTRWPSHLQERISRNSQPVGPDLYRINPRGIGEDTLVDQKL